MTTERQPIRHAGPCEISPAERAVAVVTALHNDREQTAWHLLFETPDKASAEDVAFRCAELASTLLAAFASVTGSDPSKALHSLGLKAASAVIR